MCAYGIPFFVISVDCCCFAITSLINSSVIGSFGIKKAIKSIRK